MTISVNGFAPDLAAMKLGDNEEIVNLETLNEDCFRKIVQLLPMQDRKELRLVCTGLMNLLEAVDEDILTLTARNSEDLKQILKLPHVKGVQFSQRIFH